MMAGQNAAERLGVTAASDRPLGKFIGQQAIQLHGIGMTMEQGRPLLQASR